MEICGSLFSVVFNMSLTGGAVIVAVMIVRLFLRRAPKIFSYLLWGVVLLRLLCPFSFSSVLSVFQVVDVSITQQGMIWYTPHGNAQAEIQNEILPIQTSKNTSVGADQYAALNAEIMSKKDESTQLSWNLEMVCGIVWIMGVAVMWGYSAVSIIRLKSRLIGAVSDEKNMDKNIYLCDYIGTAFVMGVLRPRIYLPTTLTENERRYILLHEETHIRRCDHIIRLLAFWALSIHWFNPLVWCAFSLSERDMEMSCDEAVMRSMGTDLRMEYSASLLNLASGKRVFAGAPLGFGEGNVKCRIQNIMWYKKTVALITVPVFALVIIVSVALGSNPAEERLSEDNSVENNSLAINDANTQQTDQNGESIVTGASIAVKPAVITDQMVCDMDGPILDYADENTLIFHHYFGLFVYDITQSRIDSSVNLMELGCLNAQNELDCVVLISEAGQRVYIHPADAVNMYVYDVSSKKLVRQHFDRESFANNTDLFGHLKLTADCINPDYTVWRSADCVTLTGYRYLYLECGSGMVEDLYYIVEQDGERVQYARIFENDTKVGGKT